MTGLVIGKTFTSKWFQHPFAEGVKFNLRFMATSTWSSIWERHTTQKEIETIDPETTKVSTETKDVMENEEAFFVECLEYIVLDWEGVSDDKGKKIEVTREALEWIVANDEETRSWAQGTGQARPMFFDADRLLKKLRASVNGASKPKKTNRKKQVAEHV